MLGLSLYRVSKRYLDRDHRPRLDEVGALEASCPNEAVRGVVGRYRAEDALEEIATDYLPTTGEVVVEPLDCLETDVLEWFADESEITVWAVDRYEPGRVVSSGRS